MHTTRSIRIRAALAALAGVLAAGTGAAYAATRGTAHEIGTGVVVIDTNLGYQDGAAAGTGMVLTSSGEVLTNNHVIAGATKIVVVVPHTNHRYTARVVGYDTTADVAVLQLQKASDLATVTTASASTLAVGTRVTALGNAGGTGSLTSAKGTVTGLNRSITAADDTGSSEQLTGLIETNADLQPGDSGGPLLNSAGRVVGMDTAASTGFSFTAFRGSDAFAIPIGKALAIAKQIVAGHSSATVHVGATAFLGVQVSDPQTAGFGFGSGSTAGAEIVGVVRNGPADTAGLAAGDVITAFDGTSVSSARDLSPLVLASKAGTKATIAYTDASGESRTATVTLGSGPPQ
jgi:S1-C subfamily serine protease